jgi:tetratricopeptide (TPR) repeat protein
VADQQRIDDLRRRVQKDPASIAFAQLAEELRRAGQFQEAVDVCHAGLSLHPGYLSARVTLGRALIELNQLDAAQAELDLVLRSAHENLAAIRGLADIHHRRGSLVEALAQYRAALALARNDPDLQRTVAELERAIEPPKPPASAEGMSFEEAQQEFLKNLPPPPPPPTPFVVPPAVEEPPPFAESPVQSMEEPVDPSHGAAIDESQRMAESEPEPTLDAEAPDDVSGRERALSTIAALEQWLDAIHVARTQPRA